MEEGRKEDEKKKKIRSNVSKLSVSEILSERNTARMEWKNKKFGERGRGWNGKKFDRVLSVSIAKPWVGRLLARHREFVKSRVTRRWRCPAEKLGVRRQSLSGIYRFCGINRIPWDPPPCKRILQFMQGVRRTSSWWLQRSETFLSLSLSLTFRSINL